RYGLFGRTRVDVGEAHLLHGVEVIEVSPVFLKAVRGWQRFRVIAKVILAELAGSVAEVAQEYGERGRAGLQICRTARYLRRDQPCSQRIHPRKERTTTGGAALPGEIVPVNCAFVAGPIDAGGFANHQATMINARLHPADVVTHDEQDVGLARLRADERRKRGKHRRGTSSDGGASRAPSAATHELRVLHDCPPVNLLRTCKTAPEGRCRIWLCPAGGQNPSPANPARGFAPMRRWAKDVGPSMSFAASPAIADLCNRSERADPRCVGLG